jgi:hypothetical protein
LPNDLLMLTGVAASIGIVHTLSGPDHYLPFIALARARGWGATKTAWVTGLCGLGHVAGSVVLGFVGIAGAAGAARVVSIQTIRGDIAAWGLIGFGLVYAAWGLRRASRSRRHVHLHAHVDGTTHAHVHSHTDSHVHVHSEAGGKRLTPWVLFTIFVFGPCEPLIPLLMYPAFEQSVAGLLWVIVVFGSVTIATMVLVVTLALAGIRPFRHALFERYGHALAGAAIFACGFAVMFLDW